MPQSEIVEALERAFLVTLDVARAVPESSLEYWPAPDTMTVREHLDHMAFCLEELTAPIARAIGHAAAEPRGAEPRQRLAESIAQAAAILRAVPEDRWDQSVVMPGDHAMSIRRVALVLLEHDAHHRGQLIVILRLLGIDPPKRWSD